MASLKAKQDDLRRLMKERRENLKGQINKVDSPFANLGQLFCIICNVQIKSGGLWASHIAGNIHKENALKKKKGTVDAIPKRSSQVIEEKPEISQPPAKKIKVSTDESLPKSETVKGTGKISLLNAYSSSEDEDDNDAPPPTESVQSNTSNDVLPKDFFDGGPTPSKSLNSESTEVVEKKPAAEAIPEGFFDDPVLDAKARNIEYKDPIEEEWERYRKAIAEETNVSKTIMEEDIEESTLEREISQIDEQIQQWERVKNLEALAEEVKAKAPSKSTNQNSSGTSDDELEEDDLLDWRSKGVKKR